MTTVIVTGRTFDHRDKLKDLGGRWDADAKAWKFDYANKHTIAELHKLVGCSVIVNDKLPPRPKPSDDDKITVERLLEIVGWSETGESDSGRKSIIYGDDARWHNHFKDKNPIAFFGFSSLSMLTRFVDAIPEPKRVGARNAGWETSDPKWHGTRNMEHALDLARNGWNEGVENAARVIDMLNVEHALQRRRKHSIAGGSVNVGRLLAGNPAHMRQRPKQPGKRVITLFVENTASASIDARQLTVRAAICAALADILERQGYSCEIVSATMQHGNQYSAAQTVVTIKQAGEKLNIEDVAFALGHPSFLRRFNFACVSQCDELKSIWFTQGMPQDAFNTKYTPERNQFYIKYLKKNVKGDTLEEIARNMLPSIIPDGLPIEIGE